MFLERRTEEKNTLDNNKRLGVFLHGLDNAISGRRRRRRREQIFDHGVGELMRRLLIVDEFEIQIG